MLLFKLIIVILLIFIVVSLFTALYRLNNEKGDSTKVVKALSVRIGLSILLFALLMLGSWLGLIEPHGLNPQQTTETVSPPPPQ